MLHQVQGEAVAFEHMEVEAYIVTLVGRGLVQLGITLGVPTIRDGKLMVAETLTRLPCSSSGLVGRGLVQLGSTLGVPTIRDGKLVVAETLTRLSCSSIGTSTSQCCCTACKQYDYVIGQL